MPRQLESTIEDQMDIAHDTTWSIGTTKIDLSGLDPELPSSVAPNLLSGGPVHQIKHDEHQFCMYLQTKMREYRYVRQVTSDTKKFQGVMSRARSLNSIEVWSLLRAYALLNKAQSILPEGIN